MLTRCFMAGLSLVEIMVSLTIMMLALSVALPAFGTWVRDMQVRAAAESVKSGFELARMEAVRRNASVIFQIGVSNQPLWQFGCDLGDCPVVVQSAPAGETPLVVLAVFRRGELEAAAALVANPVVTPVVNPAVSPVITPAATPAATPVANRAVTPVVGPAVTPAVTSPVTPAIDPAGAPPPAAPLRTVRFNGLGQVESPQDGSSIQRIEVSTPGSDRRLLLEISLAGAIVLCDPAAGCQ